MEYFQDIFYNISHLPPDKLESLCRDAKEISYKWWVDKLDGSGSRKTVEFDFDEFLKKLYDEKSFALFRFIHRRGYVDWKDDDTQWCGLVAFVSGNYYLWIYFDEKDIEMLREKYKIAK